MKIGVLGATGPAENGRAVVDEGVGLLGAPAVGRPEFSLPFFRAVGVLRFRHGSAHDVGRCRTIDENSVQVLENNTTLV